MEIRETVRETMARIFEDTKNWYESDQDLKQAAAYAAEHTKLYRAKEYPAIPEADSQRKTEIHVSADKSFQAASRLHEQYPEARIAVHNFASATNPGGGVKNGSRAQEESLCRCSLLYPCLKQTWLWESYYLYHRNRADVKYTDACIYSPDVLVIKSDTDFPERLSKEKWFPVDILTCAAPNLRRKPNNIMNPGNDHAISLTDQELFEIHVSRARHMLTIAAANQDDILILGAFGCGAFRNSPDVVARAYQTVLHESAFKNRFLHVEFAIFHTSRETANYDAFRKVFT